MELLIAIVAGVVIASLAGSKKHSKKKTVDEVKAKSRPLSQDDEDLITIILPTINSDK